MLSLYLTSVLFLQNFHSSVTQAHALPVLVVDTSGEKNVWISFELTKAMLAMHTSLEELFPQESKELAIEGLQEKIKREQGITGLCELLNDIVRKKCTCWSMLMSMPWEARDALNIETFILDCTMD